MNTGIDIVLAKPAERPLIEGLMQFYTYDFSELEPAGSDRFEVNGDGLFDAYPHLDQYWSDPTCMPLLIKAGGRVAGFALINAIAHSGGTVDHSMAEFFVLRKHRRGGVGAMVAAMILERYGGRWEIAVAARNLVAKAFWPRAVAGLGCVRDLRVLERDDENWRGPILQFVSTGASAV